MYRPGLLYKQEDEPSSNSTNIQIALIERHKTPEQDTIPASTSGETFMNVEKIDVILTEWNFEFERGSMQGSGFEAFGRHQNYVSISTITDCIKTSYTLTICHQDNSYTFSETFIESQAQYPPESEALSNPPNYDYSTIPINQNIVAAACQPISFERSYFVVANLSTRFFLEVRPAVPKSLGKKTTHAEGKKTTH